MEKNCRDLDLDRTMPNVELIQDTFVCYNIFEFQVPRLIIFLSYRAHRHTHTHRDRHTHTHTHTHRNYDKPQL